MIKAIMPFYYYAARNFDTMKFKSGEDILNCR